MNNFKETVVAKSMNFGALRDENEALIVENLALKSDCERLALQNIYLKQVIVEGFGMTEAKLNSAIEEFERRYHEDDKTNSAS